MPELKHCPFCGSRNIALDADCPPFRAQCKDCHAQGPDSSDRVVAVLSWNAARLQWQRTPPTKAGFYFYRNIFGCIQVVNFLPELTKYSERGGKWAGPIPIPVE